MTLTTFWNSNYLEFDFNSNSMNLNSYIPVNFQELFLMSCAVNTSAEIRPDEKGSKTEIAILRALDKFGYPFEEIKK